MTGIRVNGSLTIPEDEITYTFTPSGGPGGQHANKASTRVEITWDVRNSRALGPRQRHKIETNLRRRIDSSGALRLSSGTHRSQLRNRREVEDRIAGLVRAALRPARARTPTEPTRASRERRLEQKHRRAATKQMRRAPVSEAD